MYVERDRACDVNVNSEKRRHKYVCGAEKY